MSNNIFKSSITPGTDEPLRFANLLALLLTYTIIMHAAGVRVMALWSNHP
ncbi:MAG: hypothetical protein VX679_01875 [Pseudomonadota bacterium]|nr:hypothetical protein [Pseudomonadota bacterium]